MKKLLLLFLVIGMLGCASTGAPKDYYPYSAKDEKPKIDVGLIWFKTIIMWPVETLVLSVYSIPKGK